MTLRHVHQRMIFDLLIPLIVFCLLYSKNFALPVFTQILSCSCPAMSKQHLHSFNFIYLFWNNSFAENLSCPNLFMKDPRSLPQTKNIWYHQQNYIYKVRLIWHLSDSWHLPQRPSQNFLRHHKEVWR